MVGVVSVRLCTVTPLLKIVNARDFVEHVMPIDTQYVAVEKQQRRQRLVLLAQTAVPGSPSG
ncbi:hypothetical protein XFF7767_550004 [Xanthomonas citri pv. fuscans]|nr:hypothetical protein XFF7767_550004 [Xanthomonas citri pv. fuscans]SOO08306.1 hypothetical protein XFF6970_20005 [Xanthomonas citri pv. fuscans]SOO14408.1 hypothetical protein XFF7766_300004 [Xanthomonas citri pv. fuscans]SOO43144.1 hypothetical protein XFF1815_320004 [Xanthomonas citri pv. fuscans]